MKKILVPIDFSKYSIDALEFASQAAKKSNSKIYLLHIVQKKSFILPGTDPLVIPPVNPDFDFKFFQNLKNEVRKNLDNLLKYNFLKNVETVRDVEICENIYEGITEYSQKIKADMIIMGSRGLNGIKEILVGSNAQRVARFSDIPVLITSKKIQKMKKIIFASDFLNESYSAFPKVQKFAKLFDAKIYLLKVNTFDQFARTSDNLKLLNDFKKKFRINYEAVVLDDFQKEEGILHYADSINADLIAIGTHGKKGLARFFRPDISDTVIRLTWKPILIVNFKKTTTHITGATTKHFKLKKK